MAHEPDSQNKQGQVPARTIKRLFVCQDCGEQMLVDLFKDNTFIHKNSISEGIVCTKCGSVYTKMKKDFVEFDINIHNDFTKGEKGKR